VKAITRITRERFTSCTRWNVGGNGCTPRRSTSRAILAIFRVCRTPCSKLHISDSASLCSRYPVVPLGIDFHSNRRTHTCNKSSSIRRGIDGRTLATERRQLSCKTVLPNFMLIRGRMIVIGVSGGRVGDIPKFGRATRCARINKGSHGIDPAH